VLRRTQAIERDMGRTQKSVDGVYHDRIIDIDLLLFDHLNIHTPELTLPHPRMWDREFVTVPLAEIGVTRETVEQWDIEK
jgi:2-amino-4-hydroxy-6-hydroxymethyldihydropteridine diphosphokinase